LAVLAVALAPLATGCLGGPHARATGAAQTLGPATRLVDLEHPGRSPDLFSLFNGDRGVPRLVLLISPL
jgi:hypothetical protein